MQYTTFSTERIVALRSVNKIFPESYDFAANHIVKVPWGDAYFVASFPGKIYYTVIFPGLGVGWVGKNVLYVKYISVQKYSAHDQHTTLIPWLSRFEQKKI
jgi:hypothetical protein